MKQPQQPVKLRDTATFKATDDTAAGNMDPVILPEDVAVKPLAISPDQDAEREAEVDLLLSRKSGWRRSKWFWRSAGGFVVAAAGYEAYTFVGDVFVGNPILGAGLGVLLGVATLSGLSLLWGEFRSLRRLDKQTGFRQRAESLLDHPSFGEAEPLVKDISRQLEKAHGPHLPLAAFEERRQTSHDDREILQIYSHSVLAGLDKKAYDIMVRHSSEAAVLVAISPLAVADMVLVSWRSLRMMQQIATVYGCPPAFFGRLDLLKKVVRNMMLTGAGEMIADAGVEIIGGSVSSIVSSRIAQGVGVGVLTARLGLHAMKVCRPLPFDESEKPKISKVRKLLLTKVKGLVIKEKTDKPRVARHP